MDDYECQGLAGLLFSFPGTAPVERLSLVTKGELLRTLLSSQSSKTCAAFL